MITRAEDEVADLADLRARIDAASEQGTLAPRTCAGCGDPMLVRSASCDELCIACACDALDAPRGSA